VLAPGSTFATDRLDITASAGNVPAVIVNGWGFESDGSLCVDTNAVAGSIWMGGFRKTATGAVYGTTSVAGSDVWIEGVRVSVDGAVVYESAAATTFDNGNPKTANGRLAVI
jgi:hypothetical protein